MSVHLTIRMLNLFNHCINRNQIQRGVFLEYEDFTDVVLSQILNAPRLQVLMINPRPDTSTADSVRFLSSLPVFCLENIRFPVFPPETMMHIIPWKRSHLFCRIISFLPILICQILKCSSADLGQHIEASSIRERYVFIDVGCTEQSCCR